MQRAPLDTHTCPSVHLLCMHTCIRTYTHIHTHSHTHLRTRHRLGQAPSPSRPPPRQPPAQPPSWKPRPPELPYPARCCRPAALLLKARQQKDLTYGPSSIGPPLRWRCSRAAHVHEAHPGERGRQRAPRIISHLVHTPVHQDACPHGWIAQRAFYWKMHDTLDINIVSLRHDRFTHLLSTDERRARSSPPPTGVWLDHRSARLR
jgi:hypothetical protein